MDNCHNQYTRAQPRPATLTNSNTNGKDKENENLNAGKDALPKERSAKYIIYTACNAVSASLPFNHPSFNNIINLVTSTLECEDTTLGHYVRGYGKPGCAKDWILQAKYTHKYLEATKLDAVSDRVQDLQQRMNLPLPKCLTSGHQTQYISDYIAQHLTVATFSLNWQQLTEQGSKKTKTVFYELAFQALDMHEEFFKGLNQEDCAATILDNHRLAYSGWMAELRPTTRYHKK
ncbi:hypothetical protein K438DRAFT_1747137 [Mycena galopus ATCC 62051]|nr:hypothetical protein K438DRAFT_1747137 [Mycena galopus ATCC 62051]